jgi:hypothetical protein
MLQPWGDDLNPRPAGGGGPLHFFPGSLGFRRQAVFHALSSSACSSSLKISCHVYWNNEDLYFASLPILVPGNYFYRKIFS